MNVLNIGLGLLERKEKKGIAPGQYLNF